MNFRPGTVIVTRHRWRNLLWGAEPAWVVSDDGRQIVHFRPAGTRSCSSTSRGYPGREDLAQGDRQLLSMQTGDWLYRWSETLLPTLTFVEADRWCRVDLGWLPQGDFFGWYVNFQLPLERREHGYDTMDLVIDIVVDPQGQWSWKDGDDFARAKAEGLVDNEAATAITIEAERVLDELAASSGPFHPAWRDWRPPEEWSLPALPGDFLLDLALPPSRELPPA